MILLQGRADPLHPFARFGRGSRSTLVGSLQRRFQQRNSPSPLTDLAAAVDEFQRRYYRPEHMTMVVVGTESLNELQEMVLKAWPPPVLTARKGAAAAFPETALRQQQQRQQAQEQLQ